MGRSLPYGWRDFDQEVVRAIAAGDPAHVVKRDDGHMTCPVLSHAREPLSWRQDGYAKGTIPHSSEVSFRVSPTYILSSAADNFIDLLAMSSSEGLQTLFFPAPGAAAEAASADALTPQLLLEARKKIRASAPILNEARDQFIDWLLRPNGSAKGVNSESLSRSPRSTNASQAW
jgi:hypothetical protein